MSSFIANGWGRENVSLNRAVKDKGLLKPLWQGVFRPNFLIAETKAIKVGSSADIGANMRTVADRNDRPCQAVARNIRGSGAPLLCRMSAVALLGWLLLCAGPALGQRGYSSRAISPSLNSPSQQSLVHGVGRSSAGRAIHSGTSSGSFSRDSGQSVTSFNAARNNRARSAFTRRGGSRSGGRSLPSYRSPSYSRGSSGSLISASSLIRPMYSGLGAVNYQSYGRNTALVRSYYDSLNGNWAVGAPTPSQALSHAEAPDMRTFANPEVIRRLATRPADEDSTADSGASEARSDAPVSMEMVLANQLTTRRNMHLEQGWAAFKVGDYQKACNQFVLADGYSSASLSDQVEARIPLIYARVASQRYTEAGGTLKWLLETYARSPGAFERPFADMVPDLAAHYGQKRDLIQHLDELRTHISRCQVVLDLVSKEPNAGSDVARLTEDLIGAQALQLLMLYALPDDRPRATFDARAFEAHPTPWNGLARLLGDDGSDRRAASPGEAGRSAIAFPFNLFQEKPPDAAAWTSDPSE